MKLKYFFHKDRTTTAATTDVTPRAAFKPKSTFTAPVNNAAIDTFCKLVERDIESMYSSPSAKYKSNNVTKAQLSSLSSLSKNNHVIFKGADKGGGLVSMNRSDYENEVHRQLSDVDSYKKLDNNPTSTYKREIDIFLNDAHEKGYVNLSEKKFLTTHNPTIPVIYVLPKVHKPFDNFPAGRPIVSSIGSLTEPLSQFVDAHLRPLVEDLPSYLRDTGDFIDKLDKINLGEGDIFLVTMDVTSLYTNIPHDIGLAALQFFLNTRPVCSPPTDFLTEMAKMVLTKNYFLFERDFFLQIRGTAMGATFAPDYANLFMGFLEQKHVHTNNPFSDSILLFKRFIDDVIMVWRGTESQLLDFHHYMNNLVDTIHFSLEYSKNQIHFLDTWVKRDGNRLYTTLYRKPTDKNSCLHASSFHPEPTKKGLPYGQFLRIRRICQRDEDFSTEAQKLYQQFIQRGYTPQVLDSALTRVRSEGTRALLRTDTQPHKRDPPLICCTTYTPHSQQIKKIIKQHWHVLQTDTICSELFPNPPLFTHSRSPNLRDKLVHSDTFDHSKRPCARLDNMTGFFPCRNCASCNNIHKTNHFTSFSTGKRYEIRSFITCSSVNVIYLLNCPCGFQYVGCTRRQLRIRLNEHRSAINRRDPKSPVARHFNEVGHSTTDLKFMGIDRILPSRRNSCPNQPLLKTEARWIFYLKTLHPNGLNDDFDLTCFL